MNSDFESGNTGFYTEMAYVPGNIQSSQTYDLVTNPLNAHPLAASYFDHTLGDGTGHMMAVNGATTGNPIVWSETVAVAPGQAYLFRVWHSSWAGSPQARLSVLINGMVIGTDFSTPSATGVWQEFCGSWNSGTSVSATIDIVNTSNDFAGNDFALDDLSLVGSGTMGAADCSVEATPTDTPGGSCTTFFDDGFSGSTLDPANWNVSANGYPAPTVSVSSGSVQVGAPGTGSLDFPYVTSVGPVFPPSGDFSLEFALQYSSTAQWGNGFVVLGPANEQILQVWADSIHSLFAQLPPMSGVGLGSPLAPHTYRLDIVRSTATLLVDGAQVATTPLPARPERVWFGHPTVGEVAGLYAHDQLPGNVDATGVVTSRWWSFGEWTTFRINRVRVSNCPPLATPTPTPSPQVVIDQSQTAAPLVYNWGFGNIYPVQTFVPSLSTLDGVKLMMSRQRTLAGNGFFLQVCRVSDPNGSDCAHGQFVVNAFFSGTSFLDGTLPLGAQPAVVDFHGWPTATVVPGVQYALILNGNGGEPDMLYSGYSDGDPYPSGEMSSNAPGATNDLFFQTYTLQ
jgi:hypothetical protein